MKTEHLTARLPEIPSKEFLASPGNALCTCDGRTLLFYDQVTQAGVAYCRERQTWDITSPISFTDFLLQCCARSLPIVLDAVALDWWRRCDPESHARLPSGNVVPFPLTARLLTPTEGAGDTD